MKTYRPHSHHLFLLIPCFGLLVLLGSCVKPSGQVAISHPVLAEIDSLLWSRPDSAFMELRRFAERPEADSLDTFDGHCFQLLLSELLYKNDCAQTNREELLKAVGYFDSLASGNHDATLTFLEARGHYINGVGYYERDSVLKACQEYLKAVELMEERFKERELTGRKAQFMAMTYTHLCGLFDNQYLNEQAVHFGKCSLPYYNNYNSEPWHVAWVMEIIGSHYDMMEQLDSARIYYQKAEASLKDTLSLLFRDIESHLAYLEYEKKGETLLPIHRLHQLIVQAESKKEYISRCLMVGELYYQEKVVDSAKYYLNRVFDSTSIMSIKILSAQHLQEICLLSGDTIASKIFTVFLSQQANPGDNQAYTHSKLTKLCQGFVQGQKEKLFLQQRKKIMNWCIIVFLSLIMIAVIFIARSLFNKNQLEAERYTNKIQKNAIIGKLIRSNEKIRELKNQVEQQHRNEPLKNEAFASCFLEEPICQFILQQVKEGNFKSQMNCAMYKNYALNKEQLLKLRKATDHHFNLFTSRLSMAYPEINNRDLDYCCLYLLGLSDADLSALTQRAYNTINERNNKSKRIIGSEKPLSVTLQQIATDSQSLD